MKKQDEGFTLIELLIVIVILGILAAVVVFAVGGITDKGSTSACKADFKTLEVASEAYYAQTSAYPVAIGDLLSTDATSTPKKLKLLNSTPKYAALTDADATTGALGYASGVTAADQTKLTAAGCNVTS